MSTSSVRKGRPESAAQGKTNTLVSRPPNSDGEIVVTAVSGPMEGKEVRVSKYLPDAAYFKFSKAS